MSRKFVRNIFTLFSSDIRFDMLMRLHKYGKHTYSDWKKHSISANKSSNLFSFEVNVLTANHMIHKHEYTGLYDITDRGRILLDLAIQLKSYSTDIQLEDRGVYEDVPACMKVLQND